MSAVQLSVGFAVFIVSSGVFGPETVAAWLETESLSTFSESEGVIIVQGCWNFHEFVWIHKVLISCIENGFVNVAGTEHSKVEFLINFRKLILIFVGDGSRVLSLVEGEWFLIGESEAIGIDSVENFYGKFIMRINMEFGSKELGYGVVWGDIPRIGAIIS